MPIPFCPSIKLEHYYTLSFVTMFLQRCQSMFQKLKISPPSSSPISALASSRWNSTHAAPATAPANLFLAVEKKMPPRRTALSRSSTLDDLAPSVTVNENGKISCPILSLSTGKPTSTIELDASVFGTPLRRDILHRVVKWQLAKRRQGTHKTKSRSEVSGSTRKPWKQKGSGRARVKDIRAPQWRGGYTVFGKQPRSYAYPLQRQVRHMGVRVALSAKLREGKLVILDDLPSTISKTKEINRVLEDRNWKHALFIDDTSTSKINENFQRSINNLPNVDTLPQIGTNVYSILKKDILVLTKAAVEKLELRLHQD